MVLKFLGARKESAERIGVLGVHFYGYEVKPNCPLNEDLYLVIFFVRISRLCFNFSILRCGCTLTLSSITFVVKMTETQQYCTGVIYFQRPVSSIRVKVNFHCCVIFFARNDIESVYGSSRANVTVETRSTFTFRRGFPYIDFILFMGVKFTWVRGKNHATAEIHHYSQIHVQKTFQRYYLYPVNKCRQTRRRVFTLKFTRSCHWFLLE